MLQSTLEASTTGRLPRVLPETFAPSALTSAACDGADPVSVNVAVSFATETTAADTSTVTVTGAVVKPYMSTPLIVAVYVPAVEPLTCETSALSEPATVLPLPSLILAPARLSTSARVGGLVVLKYTVASGTVITDTGTT